MSSRFDNAMAAMTRAFVEANLKHEGDAVPVATVSFRIRGKSPSEILDGKMVRWTSEDQRIIRLWAARHRACRNVKDRDIHGLMILLGLAFLPDDRLVTRIRTKLASQVKTQITGAKWLGPYVQQLSDADGRPIARWPAFTQDPAWDGTNPPRFNVDSAPNLGPYYEGPLTIPSDEIYLMDKTRHLAPDVSAMAFGIGPPAGPATLKAMPVGSVVAHLVEGVVKSENIARDLAPPRRISPRTNRAGRSTTTTEAPSATAEPLVRVVATTSVPVTVAEPVLGSNQAQRPGDITTSSAISQTGATSNAALAGAQLNAARVAASSNTVQADDPVLRWASEVVPQRKYNAFLELYRANGDLEAWTEGNLGLRHVVGLLKAQFASSLHGVSVAGSSDVRAFVTPPRTSGVDSAYASREQTEEPRAATPSGRTPAEVSSGNCCQPSTGTPVGRPATAVADRDRLAREFYAAFFPGRSYNLRNLADVEGSRIDEVDEES